MQNDTVEKKLKEIERSLEFLSQNGKDPWRRASVATTFLSGVVIAGLAAWWTHEASVAEEELNKLRLANETATLELRALQQRTDALERPARLDLSALQVVEKFVPYVAGDPTTRQVALVALSELGQANIALKLGQLYADPETRAAQDQIQLGAIPPDQRDIPAPIRAAAPSATGNEAAGNEATGTQFRGWVYLGQFSGDAWITRYLDFPQSKSPEGLSGGEFAVRMETGALNVRSDHPSPSGVVRPVMATLSPGSIVKLIGKPETTFSRFVWHQVEYIE